MKKKLTIFLFGLLLAVGWTNAFAQQQATVSPAERLTLTVVDNQSVYDVDAQTNTYTNTLQLGQPTGPYKFTGDLLKEGDNYMILHRMDNLGGDVECSRINLNAVTESATTRVIGALDFLNDFQYTGYYLNNSDLAAYPGWSTSGNALAVQDNGYAFANPPSSDNNFGIGLSFTIPEDCYLGDITVTVDVGVDVGGGHYSYSINGQDPWTVLTTTVSAYQTFSWVIENVKAGDVIAFCGATYRNNSYSLSYTPDIGSISITYTPNTSALGFEITPTISKKENDVWGTEESLGETFTCEKAELLDFTRLANLVDEFSVSTSTNDYPDNYSYYVTMMDANIELPDPTESSIVYPIEDVDMSMSTSATVPVLGLNIENEVTITTTGGFTVSPSSLTADQMNQGQDVTVTYSGSELYAVGTLTVATGDLSSTINLSYGMYGCVNFLNSTATNVNYAEYIGLNNWQFNNVSMYNGEDSNNQYLAYFQPGGNIVFSIPESFNGSAVTVTILSGTSGADSTGDLWVNGVLHTYTAENTSYTWTLSNVTPGGTITIYGPSDGLSLDIAKIEIAGVR